MTKLDYNCRICGQPGTVEAPDEYEPEKHSKWLRMVCHDFCNSVREERIRQQERISRSALLLIRLDSAESSDRKTATEKIRAALTSITRAWARNECRWMGSRVLYWSEEMVNATIETPNHWGGILKNARAYIRTQCIEELGVNGVNQVYKSL
jgi:hypothetical protein